MRGEAMWIRGRLRRTSEQVGARHIVFDIQTVHYSVNGECECRTDCDRMLANQPVCGTDNVVYPSECHLAARSCQQRIPIRIQDKENCSMLCNSSFSTVTIRYKGILRTAKIFPHSRFSLIND
jgi:hypothetical protein